MDLMWCVLAAALLPLFPASWLFNRAVARLPIGAAQGVAALVLPQLGLALLRLAPAAAAWPHAARDGGMVVATLSALLYAVRALSARDLGIWTRLVLSSGLATIWLAWLAGTPFGALRVMALGWGLPAAVALVLAGVLVRRMGGAYIGLQGGLVAVMPRLTASLVLAILALTATPVFSPFFALWKGLGAIPVAWLPFWLPLLFLWGWAAGRLFQDLLFGDYRGEKVADISGAGVAVIALVFVASVALSFVANGGAL